MGNNSELHEVNPEEYIEGVLRTKSGDHAAMVRRLSDPLVMDLLHVAMGMATEAGEILDQLKRHIFYGSQLDDANIEEELGDSSWYSGLGVWVLRQRGRAISWGSMWLRNLKKLEKRYPEKFEGFLALNRNLDSERRVLEADMRGVPDERVKEVVGSICEIMCIGVTEPAGRGCGYGFDSESISDLTEYLAEIISPGAGR